jgi:hypothetical protein
MVNFAEPSLPPGPRLDLAWQARAPTSLPGVTNFQQFQGAEYREQIDSFFLGLRAIDLWLRQLVRLGPGSSPVPSNDCTDLFQTSLDSSPSAS